MSDDHPETLLLHMYVYMVMIDLENHNRPNNYYTNTIASK